MGRTMGKLGHGWDISWHLLFYPPDLPKTISPCNWAGENLWVWGIQLNWCVLKWGTTIMKMIVHFQKTKTHGDKGVPEFVRKSPLSFIKMRLAHSDKRGISAHELITTSAWWFCCRWLNLWNLGNTSTNLMVEKACSTIWYMIWYMAIYGP